MSILFTVPELTAVVLASRFWNVTLTMSETLFGDGFYGTCASGAEHDTNNNIATNINAINFIACFMIVSPVHDVFPYLRDTYRLALIIIGSHIERFAFY